MPDVKKIVIVGGGMADYPVKKLGGKTPLMVARTPALDRIAWEGRCGQFVTVEADMPPGSEVANLTILGYDPHECFQGRGVLEAASQGVTLGPRDISMRCNLITVYDGRIKSHSAGHIPTEEGRQLIAEIQARLGNPIVRFHPGSSYRHLIVLSQGSPAIECSPPHDHVGRPISEIMIKARNPEANLTADLLNELIVRSYPILHKHPVNQARLKEDKDEANYIWPWSPGRRPVMAKLKERFGISAAVVSAVDLIRGIGIYAGMDVIRAPGATGLWDTDYESKADACFEALADHDFVYCHVDAPNEAGHNKDVDLKVKAIEDFDQRLVGRLLNALEEKGIPAVLAVLSDHLTPVEYGNHVLGPVPAVIWDPRQPGDNVTVFDELSVRDGALGVMRGRQFMDTVCRA